MFPDERVAREEAAFATIDETLRRIAKRAGLKVKLPAHEDGVPPALFVLECIAASLTQIADHEQAPSPPGGQGN